MDTTPLDQCLDILIDALVSNDKLRHAFFFNPIETLRHLGDHGVPLNDDEVQALCGARRMIWERVADVLRGRLAHVS